MINAQEARGLTREASTLAFEKVSNHIRQAAKKGDRYVSYPLNAQEAKFFTDFKVRLLEAGFQVDRQQKNDQRDTYDNVIISW